MNFVVPISILCKYVFSWQIYHISIFFFNFQKERKRKTNKNKRSNTEWLRTNKCEAFLQCLIAGVLINPRTLNRFEKMFSDKGACRVICFRAMVKVRTNKPSSNQALCYQASNCWSHFPPSLGRRTAHPRAHNLFRWV
uniref:Uncharacterized protein n=1 Tax=Anopheles funestus TaxID=62324 RepID=A0A182S136_ANOFN